MKKIKWGIIGCGDVTEIKSGPAFNKVANSSLIAVMRRDAAKAKDYAERHGVPKWYSNANDLINDEEVNAIYVATPPSSHKEYTMAAINAGKPVYVEKPMAINFTEASEIVEAAKQKNVKVVIAHYRREQPLFKKIKALLQDEIVAKILFANMQFLKRPLTKEELAISKTAWRVDAAIAGGGLFHDLAPHQLDLMYYFFGAIKNASGFSSGTSNLYNADDVIAGNILFENGVLFNGLWCFNIPNGEEKDICEIVGTNGKIVFNIFGEPKISVIKNNKIETIDFPPLQHVQQPMIEKVVEYFLDESPNPCSSVEGAEIMKLLDIFTNKQLQKK